MGKEQNNSYKDDFFTRIYSKYYINVYRKIKNILYSKVDDDITSCVHETFEKAWIKIDTLKNHKNAAGWLMETAKNVAYNFNSRYSTRQKFAADSEDIENIVQEDFTQEIVEKELYYEYAESGIAEKFLNQLSERESQFYDLKFIKKLSNEEIGKILGISAHAVVVKSGRMIEKFKKDFLDSKK